MIETLRTTQIAFLIRNTFWASGEAEARYKKYLCKGKSYETTCENIRFLVPDPRVFPTPGARFSAQTTENRNGN